MNKLKNYFKIWLIPILAILLIVSCDDRDKLTSSPILTSPTVISTNPVNAAVNVPFNQSIVVTFSEEMDSAYINTATFTLMQGTSFVSGTVTSLGNSATFKPLNNLLANTKYTATITTMAKSLLGSRLEKNYIWNFTTGATALITPPSVSSTNPLNAATSVPINQKIAATFSVVMDATTITTSTFTVLQGTTPVVGFVSYSGTTALFTPANNFAPNTAFTATITTGADDLAGNSLTNNYTWSFTTGAIAVVTPPTVSSTNPNNAAVGVPINQSIGATFSVAMDATTITASTFTVLQGTTPVPGFVSYSGTTAIFNPTNDFAANTLYKATITTGASDLAGNAIANNHVWSFTTGAIAIVTPPTVSSTDPVNAETNVALNQKITATFSKTMDVSTITTATFTLMQGATFVSGTVFYVGTTATYSPTNNLTPSTTYTATITTGAKDLTGNALTSNYVWSFTTGAAIVVTPPIVSLTDPLNLATGVALNSKIAATFSKTMDASTITASTYTLMQGTTSVSGFVSYSGKTSTFTPAINLLPNTLYTATITTGSKDLAGNTLAANYVWSFTTGAAVVVTPPTVTSTNPANLATAVPLNQKVATTFSKSMDPLTITTATFTLKQGTTAISGFISYSGTTAYFTPASNLAPTTEYTATITTGAKDLAGNAIATNYVWNFTTGSSTVIIPPTVVSTDPIDLATCVALNKQVKATFSKEMDASTITTAIFTVMENNGTTFISGTVGYVGTTATFTPLTNFKPNTTYIATITTGAKDLTGNEMTANHIWRFTTVVPYVVTLSSNPALGGTTTGAGTFNSCSSVTVTATPNVGYTFTNWTESGTIVSTNANYTFELSENRTLVANFVPIQYTVVLSSNPTLGGSTSGSGTFDGGSNVTVTATPNVGFTFTNWTEGGNIVSTNANYTFVLSENKTLIANFTAVIVQFSVSLSSNPALGGNTSGGGNFDEGSNVTVTATPNVGFTFTNWTENGNIVSTNANYTFVLLEDKVFVANFSAIIVVQYNVSLSSNPAAGGNTSGGGDFDEGSNVTVTASSNVGYAFTNWTENGNIVSTNSNYTFVLLEDKVFVANFILSGQMPVDLGTAARFAILSNSQITNISTSDIKGDVGLSPGVRSNITGFFGFARDPGLTYSTSPEVTQGFIYAADDGSPTPAMLIAAKSDAESAYLDATAATRGTPTSISGNLNGLTLAPGLYESGSSIEISPGGKLYLDAGGDANAVFIFRSATSITTESTSEVVLAGSANAANIYWVAGSAVTLGTNSIMKGTIIASTSISLLTGSTLEGRAIIQSAAAGMVSLDQSTIVLP